MHSDVDVMCLYGFEKTPDEMICWLNEKEHRALVILDDRLFHHQPEHPRARSFFLPPGGEEEVFKQVAWDYLFLRFGYKASPEKEGAGDFFCRLRAVQDGVHLVASDWSSPDMQVVKNALTNIAHISKARGGKDLFGAFKGTPALICGSGPSLEKNRHLLEELSSRALFFVGGSALAVLSQDLKEIHFAAAIDPAPPEERFKSQSFFEAPFFYQNRVSPSLLNLVHGERIYLADSGSSLVEQEMFEGDFFDGGWNVATFCTAVATALGCSPIIFVGMDLAAAAGQIYASGALPTSSERGHLIEVTDEAGKSFASKRDWMVAREWLEAHIKAHPETVFLNATEGGIGIPGAQSIPLSEVKERYLQVQKNLQGIVWAALQELTRLDSQEEKRNQMRESFSKLKELCRDFLARAEEIHPEPFARDGICSVLLFELEEEVAYKQVFAPFWEIWRRIIAREGKGDPHMHKILLIKHTLESF